MWQAGQFRIEVTRVTLTRSALSVKETIRSRPWSLSSIPWNWPLFIAYDGEIIKVGREQRLFL